MTAPRTLNGYLKDLEKALSPLPENDIKEILNEIESLALAALEEGAGSKDLNAVLDELGPPKILAAQYKAHINHGARLPLIVHIARGTARGASKTFRWFVAGLGFVIGGGILSVAVLKPIMPDIIGFWVGNGGLIVGYPGAQPGFSDLLGYWIIPLAILTGSGVIFLTFKLKKHLK